MEETRNEKVFSPYLSLNTSVLSMSFSKGESFSPG